MEMYHDTKYNLIIFLWHRVLLHHVLFFTYLIWHYKVIYPFFVRCKVYNYDYLQATTKVYYIIFILYNTKYHVCCITTSWITVCLPYNSFITFRATDLKSIPCNMLIIMFKDSFEVKYTLMNQRKINTQKLHKFHGLVGA